MMSTLIICPACQTRYEIAAVLPPEGRKVRCSKCNHVWQATAVGPVQEPAQQALSAPQPPLPPQMAPAPQAPQASQSEARAAPAAVNPAFRGFAGIMRPAHEPPALSVPPMAPAAQAPEPEPGLPERPAEPMVRDAEFDIGSDFEADIIDFDVDAPAPRLNGPGDSFPAIATESQVPAFEEFTFGSMSDAATGAEPANASLGEEERKPRSFATKGWGLLALLVAILAGFFLLAPRSVVSMLPGAARLYAAAGMPVNLRGLAFEGVHYSWNTDGGQAALRVEGEIVNVTSGSVDVPAVVIGLHDSAGKELSQLTTKAQGEQLAAGEHTPFMADIPSPPETVRSVKVHFTKAE
jgi:predicted Zn finger-like uncharacterized protein